MFHSKFTLSTNHYNNFYQVHIKITAALWLLHAARLTSSESTHERINERNAQANERMNEQIHCLAFVFVYPHPHIHADFTAMGAIG